MELLPVITPRLSFSHAGSSLIHLDPSSYLPLALPLKNKQNFCTLLQSSLNTFVFSLCDQVTESYLSLS